jgi:hypothetical protein
MIDEKGNKLSEKDILKTALDHLGEACCFLYETESDQCHALAFIVDSALKLGQVIHRDDDILSASADYTAYENECFKKHKANKKVKK